MKIKYKQKRPKLLQEMLDKIKIGKNFDIPNILNNIPKIDIKNCPNCGNMYDMNCNKKVCLKCFALLPQKKE